MLIRLLLVLSALLIVVSGGLYLFTNNQRYLKFAWQVVRFVFLAGLVFVVLLVLERYAWWVGGCCVTRGLLACA
jgi:intracellular septation protein A